jgi:DNA-binding transcriptional regulator YhcF (GntR family)
MAPRIRFDPASGVPALHQIVENLRVLLVDGELAAGAPLPSVRRLAMELGVHFNTVAEAYRELAAEGWLTLSHGRGAVVAQRAVPASADRGWAEEFRSRVRGLAAQVRSRGIPASTIADELRAMAEVLDKS